MNYSVDKPDFILPKYSEIPGVGLFLEQVAKYINEYLSPLCEPELTGSMISNYVKKGIIDNPVKKQYGRDQIANLIFIAIAKIVLSLEDVNALLSLQRDICDTQTAYEFFREDFTKILYGLFEGRELPQYEANDNSEKDTAKKLARDISITVAHKVYLDMIFDSIRIDKDNKENS